MSMVAEHFPQALLLTPLACHWGAAERVLEQVPRYRRRTAAGSAGGGAMMLWHALIDPFLSFGFMRRALMACLALSLSAPAGRVSAVAPHEPGRDALSHAVLPGAAIGYLISGMSLVAMGVGGFIAGLAVAMLSGLVSRRTPLKEDASFAGFYLGSLALGVTLVSLRGSSVDLLHVLFGSILAVDAQAMVMVGAIASVSLLALAALYRALVIESFDVTFLRVNAPRRLALIHGLFLALVVVNLVAGFQILGTLMSVGLMMLPAASARFWARNLPQTLATAMGIGALSSVIGLVWSYYASLPAGPAIVLSASVIFSSRSCLERAEAFAPSRAVEVPFARRKYETFTSIAGGRCSAGQPMGDGEDR